MEDLITPILRGIEQEITAELEGSADGVGGGGGGGEAGGSGTASSRTGPGQGLDAPPASRLSSLEPESLAEACANRGSGQSRLDTDELVDEGTLVNQILDDEEDEDIMVEGDVSVSIFARDHVGDDEVSMTKTD